MSDRRGEWDVDWGVGATFLIGSLIVAFWAESWLVLVAGLFLWAMFSFKKHEDKAQSASRATHRAAYDKVVREIIESSLPKIRLASSQLASTSPMGMEDTKRFDSEVLKFLIGKLRERRAFFDWVKHAYPGKQPEEALAVEYDRWIRRAIFTRLNEPASAREAVQESPQDFEARCARLLKEDGWLTTLTPRTGDYGVDIIARQDGLMVVLQCKRYKSPVGLSAVQEIVAGRFHYRADFAVVVSESGYTKAAINLAQSNDVFLIHPRDLLGLWQYCPSRVARK